MTFESIQRKFFTTISTVKLKKSVSENSDEIIPHVSCMGTGNSEVNISYFDCNLLNAKRMHYVTMCMIFTSTGNRQQKFNPLYLYDIAT